MSAPLDVAPGSDPQQREVFGEPFPAVLACRTPDADAEAARAWAAEHRGELDAASARHGAVLFRGLPLRGAEDFDAFVRGFDYPNFPYDQSLSNAVRVNLTPRVFTANEAPPSATIELHHEMAQTPRYPHKLFFFCETPAERGGATSLCRSDWLLERLREETPDFVRDCEAKGLRYTHVLPPDDDPASGLGRSWRSTFRAAGREEAEARMRRLGYAWEWLPDGCLRATTPALPAVREIAPGRRSFFNQLIAAFAWRDERNDPARTLTHGDGSPVDAEAAAHAARRADELSVDVAWRPGDVVLVDNLVVMHGRRSFEGRRRVLASLALARAG